MLRYDIFLDALAIELHRHSFFSNIGDDTKKKSSWAYYSNHLNVEQMVPSMSFPKRV